MPLYFSELSSSLFSYFFEGVFIGENQEKLGGGGGLSPPGKNQNRNQSVFLSFGADALNWQSFTEIGEMACSMTAQCTRGTLLIVNKL